MSENYEVLLCAGLLASPDLIESISIEAKCFKDSRTRDCYTVLDALKDGEVNPATVCQELENKGWKNVDAVKYVSTLVGLFPDPPELKSLQFYADKVSEAHGKRTLARKTNDLLGQIKDPGVPLNDNIAALSQLAVSSQVDAGGSHDPTSDGIVTRMIDQMDRKAIPAFSSGLTLLDAALASGGIEPGQVWFVVGPYGSFKTRVALHMCDAAIEQGKSVAYFGLEDDDRTYSIGLMASHFGIAEGSFKRRLAGEATPAADRVDAAINWLHGLGPRWKVYDRRFSGVSNWKRFSPIIKADKLKHGTDLVVVDHVQLWSKEYDVLGEISNVLMDVAQQAEVALVVLSQISNETMRMGAPAGMLPTKGSGDFGAIAHVGLEIVKPERFEFYATPELIEGLGDSARYLNSKQLVSEIGVRTKKVRKGNAARWTMLWEPFSGKVLSQQENAIYIDFK